MKQNERKLHRREPMQKQKTVGSQTLIRVELRYRMITFDPPGIPDGDWSTTIKTD
jgi:hypothetical protein